MASRERRTFGPGGLNVRTGAGGGSTPAAPPTRLRRPPAEIRDRLGYVLHMAFRVADRAALKALAPFGLTVRHFGVLTFLRTRGPQSQRTIGEAMGVDRTTMVSLIDDLERAGHVERVRNAADRRAYAIELTPAGRRLQRRAFAALGEADREVFAPLDEDERRTLHRLLARVARLDVDADE